MKKLKIALFTTTFPPKLGGIATSNFNIYNLLEPYHDIKVFVYNDTRTKSHDAVVKRDVPQWLIKIASVIIKLYLKKYKSKAPLKVTQQNLIFALKVFFLNRPLKAFNPDIILIADNGIPAYTLRKPKNSKLIWFARNNYYRFKNRRLCQTIATKDLEIACSMERRAIRKADALVSPSQYMVEVCKTSFNLNVPIFVNRNIILKELINSVAINDIRTPLKLPKTYPIVYIPSAGSSIKGKRYVYEIIRRLITSTNNRVGFYLSGPLPSDLDFELELLSEAFIYKPGHLTWEKNLANVKSCTLCITPNLIENYSNALLEAQTVNIPVVAFDTGGNKEIVKHQETGEIVPYLDIDKLIERSHQLLKQPETLQQYRLNCEAHIAEIANDARILDQYHEIFDTLSNSKDNRTNEIN